MSVDNKVPEIRFEEFNREWNYLTLGENAKFTKGQGYSKGDLVTSGTSIILYGRLYTKYQTVITSVDTFVTEKDKSVKSIGGEVIVPASGESPEDISRASVVSEPNVILGSDLNIILPSKKIHSTFLALAISNGRLKNKLSSKAQGKSVIHIRNSDLADLVLILPTEYIEQTTIGNYFQKLDTLINQHQQKHNKLNSIKKAMLEKMFPKQDETMPEIRFKGFSGEWEEVQVGDISKTTIGEFVKQTKQNPNSPYPVFNGGKSFTGHYDDYNNEGDKILVSARGANAGFVNYQKTRFWAGNSCYSIDLNMKSEYHTIFVYFSIKRIQYLFTDFQQAANIPSVSKSDVEKFKFMTPSFKEQTTIGNYFQKLDALINQHQQQITKLNNIKQACLSKMFI